MAHIRQGVSGLLAGRRFDLDVQPARPLDPGAVQSGLRVHVVVDGVHQHLYLPLGLHKAAHDAEGTHRLPVLHQEAGDDGVVAAFAAGQAVVAVLVHGEVGPPVLKGDAGARNEYAGAEDLIVALNEGYHVPLAIRSA